MYEEFFGFREPPFRITPDPRFLYRNPCVEEAAAALAYGIERRKGFLALVGEAGTGKTTLLRHVLDTLSGNVRTVLLLHPTVGFDEILEYILTELGIPIDGARKLVRLQRLNEFLLEHTRAAGNVALLIDEAQDLDATVLEELRLLSNLETGTEKILQIVLAGQPELETKLGDPGLRQLRQRIALHVRLRPLSGDEVAAYIHTRLEHAGAPRADIFAPQAIVHIAAVSHGIPRVINVLCDACLVTTFATGGHQVTQAIVEEAWADYSRLVSVEPVVATAPTPPAAAPQAPVAPPPPLVAVAEIAPPPQPPSAAPPPVAVDSPPPVPLPRTAAPAAVEARTSSAVPPPHPTVVPKARPFPEVDIVAPSPVPASGPVSPRLITVALVAAIVAVLVFHTSHMLLTTPDAPAVPAPTALAPAPAPTPEPPAEEVAAETAPPIASAAATPSAPEARAIVHEFLLAYEARDVGRMMRLYAPEAVENGRQGRAAIEAEYARTFARLSDVTYSIPSVDVATEGDRVALSAPFVISYRDAAGAGGEMRGRAEWEIVHRDGKPRIVELRYTFVDAAS